MLAGDQCGTEGPHDTGNVRTYGFTTGDTFEAAQYGIIVEGSTLYNNLFAEILRVSQLDYL